MCKYLQLNIFLSFSSETDGRTLVCVQRLDGTAATKINLDDGLISFSVRSRKAKKEFFVLQGLVVLPLVEAKRSDSVVSSRSSGEATPSDPSLPYGCMLYLFHTREVNKQEERDEKKDRKNSSR